MIPTRLTRTILLEILKIFVVSLVVLTTIILLIAVARELIRKGLGPMAVLQLLPFAIPISLQHAVPATALFSVCCVYGRMAADGEVSTVKSSGISPLRLLQPAIIFAALLSPVAVYCSDTAVSWGKPGVKRVVLLSVEDIAYKVLEAQHSFTSDHGFSIHVRDVIDRRMISPTVIVRGKSDDAFEVTASEGQLLMDEERQALVLKLVDSKVVRGEGLQGIVPGESTFEIPLGNALDDEDIANVRPSELPLRLISRERSRQSERTHAAIGQLAAFTGFALLKSRPEEIGGTQASGIHSSLVASERRLTRLQTEPWRRWAEGFTCFFFVIVGAPLAILAKTSDYWTTFGMCFLPIILIYYPLYLFGLDEAKNGDLPPYGVWAGNVVLAGIGSILMVRVRRY
ncbi:lipopolysaccharide export system permease protein [Neorhodopirellula lusitana]|uniref:Lipopolysaccharide export system permease protein n=1 Tax=Neorhodopirellula lusitana TaxID=445327 RepID=A0ABY1QEL5_9BACT|nr:LptF/LptG family permease [Neorhodopirellula lusitana]SMP65512.1 lipopolysaccharide export system permease protein [Neorhodopirellula lusitana]